MGLLKAELFHRIRTGWAVAGTIALAALSLQLGGAAARDALMYDRLRIAGGEIYRRASGHLVHLDWRHLSLNLAGLVLVWALVGSRFRVFQWLVIIAASAAIIDGAFWWLLPELRWYVGLSGVLHGLLVAGAIGLYRERRAEAIVLLAVVAVKLAYESLVGPMPGSSDAIGGNVITEAHLYGALGGAVAAVIIVARADESAQSN